MTNEYITATRAQLLAALRDATDVPLDWSVIDAMELYSRYRFALMSEIRKASRGEWPPLSFLDCSVYVTRRAGTYGHQFRAVIRISTDADAAPVVAIGPKTGGCGYNKVSQAVCDVLRAVGLSTDLVAPVGGTGDHRRALRELAGKLAGRKNWVEI